MPYPRQRLELLTPWMARLEGEGYFWRGWHWDVIPDWGSFELQVMFERSVTRELGALGLSPFATVELKPTALEECLWGVGLRAQCQELRSEAWGYLLVLRVEMLERFDMVGFEKLVRGQ